MKSKNLYLIALLFVFLSGCMVFSFYPLYTDDDLYANDFLLGEWIDSDSSVWQFEFNYKGEHKPENLDSTAYILRIKEDDKLSKKSFLVHLIKLDDHYFLDFYLDDYFDKDPDLFDWHALPVHSFAKLELENGEAKINWFDPEWLEDLIEQNRIRIHHENNGENILLTAKPKELQKFVVKYVNSEEAFKDGVDVELHRIKK
jgi:hypothetical protein